MPDSFQVPAKTAGPYTETALQARQTFIPARLTQGFYK